MTDRLDLRGLRCPIPVIRLETRMRSMGPGEALKVLADDPLAKIDLPHAAREAGFACAELPADRSGAFTYMIVAPEK